MRNDAMRHPILSRPFSCGIAMESIGIHGSLRSRCVRCVRVCSTHCAYAATADPSFDTACENDLASLSHLCARSELDLFAAALAQLLKGSCGSRGSDLGFGNHVAYRRGRRPRLQLQNLCPSASICG